MAIGEGEEQLFTCATDNLYPRPYKPDQFALGEIEGQRTVLKVSRKPLDGRQPTGMGQCYLDEEPLDNPRNLVGATGLAGGRRCNRCGADVNYTCTTNPVSMSSIKLPLIRTLKS